jgi:hypothetical protein
MKRFLSSGNAHLLAALTMAIAACGTSETTTGGGGGADAATDGSSSGASDAAPDQLAQDGATSDGAASDAGSDACPPGSAPDGDGGCLPLTVRRPFLVGSHLRAAEAVARSDWSGRALPAADVDEVTRRWLAEAWLRDGLEEHASVAAFARFTMLMMSVGAPPELIAASQRASLDEVRHAEDCFALAARYGGAARGPSPLSMQNALNETSLAEIVALTAEEGCVGETLGASLAAEQLAVATDPAVRRALARIAADEARHAELAWRFVAWAIAKGGEHVRRMAIEAIEGAIAKTRANPVRTYPGVDEDAWRAHGRLACADARAASERAIEEVLTPCVERLRGRESAAPLEARAS